MATFSKRIQLRRDTAANWASSNPVLLEGELGLELDDSRNRIKIGNGSDAWSDLPYFLDAREEEVGDYDDFLEGLSTP